MKSLTTKLVQLTAGIIVVGGMAFGQTKTMTADVPFAFRAANNALPAGSYTLMQEIRGSTSQIWLRNTTTGRAVVTLPNPTDIYKRGSARMLFSCVAGACTLSEIRTSAGSASYPASRKARHVTENASLVSLPITLLNGD